MPNYSVAYAGVFMDIMDYIDWRGDLNFEERELNEIDALIFCQLSYLDFDKIVPSDFEAEKSLRDVSTEFFASDDFERRSHLGPMINSQTVKMLDAAGRSARFGKVNLCGYSAVLNPEIEEQFSALTFRFSGVNFIAFRGTDSTLVGWKEDFNLAFMKNVPAQRDALDYLNSAAKALLGTFAVGGHSKGGNLAVYACVNANSSVKERIQAIYNNDGPGFSKEFFECEKFLKIKPLLHTFVPEFSIVGMLFAQTDYVVVKSAGKNIWQHDPFTWLLERQHFMEVDGTNSYSHYISRTVNGWLDELSLEQRRTFVETMFGLLYGTKAVTAEDLVENGGENFLRILKAAHNIDPQTKNVLFKTISLLKCHAIDGVVQGKKVNNMLHGLKFPSL